MTIESIKAIKDYGVTAVLVFALVWMNSKTNQMDEKLTTIQNRLYDCFEQRIKDNSYNNMFGHEKRTSFNDVKVYGILPDEIKIKNERNC